MIRLGFVLASTLTWYGSSLAQSSEINQEEHTSRVASTSDSDQITIEPDESQLEDSRRPSLTTSTRFDFEPRAGRTRGDSTGFIGSSFTLRARFRWPVSENVEVTVVTDHDPGEPLGAIPQPFDYASASILVSEVGPIRTFVAGALRPQYGLGLTVWAGQRIGGFNTSPSRWLRPRARVRPDASAYETLSQRGVGIDVSVTSWLHISAFGTHARDDARLDEHEQIMSQPASGLHRTVAENSRRDTVTRRLIGGSLILERNSLRLGAAAVSSRRSARLAPSNRSYQRFRFDDTLWKSGSIFFSGSLGRSFHWSSEAAIDHDNDFGFIALARTRASRGLDFYASLRHYPPGFTTEHGSLPGPATSTNGNETGITFLAHWRNRTSHVRIFHDTMRRPWLNFANDRPSTSDSWGIEGRHVFKTLLVLVRYASNTENLELSDANSITVKYRRRSRLRARAQSTTNAPIRLQADLAIVWSEGSKSPSGQTIGQQIRWRPTHAASIVGGTVLFATKSGNSAVYLYEPDLPNYLSIPAFVGRGYRIYCLLELHGFRHFGFWIKGGLTRFDVSREIGSGVDKRTVRQLRTISVALRYTL